MNSFRKFFPVSIAPLVTVILGIFMFLFFDPFYSRSIDPEFPYLVNGLNIALLKFNYIGHYDHPGTPFQIFNGIVILITYLFTGHGSVAQDVFSRPEHYLNAISAFLLIIQAALIFVLGWLGIKRKIPSWQILILQTSCFFNDVLIWLFARVNPDRFFMIVGLLFIIVYLQHGYERRSPLKFAFWSGVVMALGLATKFNFLPVLILPLLIIETNKNRLIYASTGVASFFIFISPIITKFDEYFNFITSIFKHDGLYGGGEAHVINFVKMKESLIEIFKLNPGLYLLFAALIVLTIIAFRKRKEGVLNFVVLFFGFLAIISLQMVMVSKHFKNYYLAPTFILYGIFFFSFSIFLSQFITNKRRLIFISSILPFSFMLITSFQVKNQYEELTQIIAHRNEMRKFVDSNISKDDIWFVEPTWEAGPYAENGLVYGLSYCGHRTDYLSYLRKVNPNTITFEDNNEVVKQWRGSDVAMDSIVATGKNIYIYSSPGRRAQLLLDMVKQTAEKDSIHLSVESVYSDKGNKEDIIKVKALNPNPNWHSKKSIADIRQMKIEQYINSIKNSPDWLEKVKKKAIDKKIPLDSMILLDAIYMANQVN